MNCCGAVSFHSSCAVETSGRARPPYFAERQPYVGELLLEGFVHVLLEVRRLDVLDDSGLGERGDSIGVGQKEREPERESHREKERDRLRERERE